MLQWFLSTPNWKYIYDYENVLMNLMSPLEDHIGAAKDRIRRVKVILCVYIKYAVSTP
jgi:hypothetical protein